MTKDHLAFPWHSPWAQPQPPSLPSPSLSSPPFVPLVPLFGPEIGLSLHSKWPVLRFIQYEATAIPRAA